MPSERTLPAHATLIDVADARGGLPSSLAPMLPRLAAGAFNSPDHLFEVKWDGIRAMVFMDSRGIRIRDRHGEDLLALVPELGSIRLPEGTLLDGEVVVCDRRGRPSYELLASRFGPKRTRSGTGPLFAAFDLLYEDHQPLLGLPLVERRRRLLDRGYTNGPIVVPEHLEADGEPFLEVVEEYGLEGIVAKRRDSPYVPGARTADWLKCHVTPRADVVLGGLVSGPGGTHTALCGLVTDDGSLTFAGEAFVPTFLAGWLDEMARPFASDRSPFAGPIALRPGLRWLHPRVVAIVEHDGTRGTGLRDATLRTLRLDGRAEDCVAERPVEIPSVAPTQRSDRPRLVVLHSLPLV